MLAKRIIPCLDVRDGMVVKGVKFQAHRVVGNIVELATRYAAEGADELVFYDITASSDHRLVSLKWISLVAAAINIPFTVAGGIRNVSAAKAILNAGADKISINSPALASPHLIDELSDTFGKQCVVVGIDSKWVDDDYYVYQYTGDVTKTLNSRRKTREWVVEVQRRGAGEIVLNCMQHDGVGTGFDITQLQQIRALTQVPLVASGGAGKIDDFVAVFQQTAADAALAASVFHDRVINMARLKQTLAQHNIEVRLCI